MMIRIQLLLSFMMLVISLTTHASSYCDGYVEGYLSTWTEGSSKKPRFPGCPGNPDNAGQDSYANGQADGGAAATTDIEQSDTDSE